MRISGLSAETGVPVATIKYYLREGLLQPGERTSATQAQYDQAHVRRLRLVRALLGPAGLSIGTVRAVLESVDGPADGTLDRLGRAQAATAIDPASADGVDLGPAQALIARAGWTVDPDGPEVRQLAVALAALADAGFEIPEANLTVYLEAITRIADTEIAGVPAGTPDAADDGASDEGDEDAVRYAVLGTILVEPVLLAMRRIAQQSAAIERFGG
jgi:DNA-binding transcriptional MerR regulator